MGLLTLPGSTSQVRDERSIIIDSKDLNLFAELHAVKPWLAEAHGLVGSANCLKKENMSLRFHLCTTFINKYAILITFAVIRAILCVQNFLVIFGDFLRKIPRLAMGSGQI